MNYNLFTFETDLIIKVLISRIDFFKALLFEGILLIYLISFCWLTINNEVVPDKSFAFSTSSFEQVLLLENSACPLIKSYQKHIVDFKLNAPKYILEIFRLGYKQCVPAFDNKTLVNILLTPVNVNAP